MVSRRALALGLALVAIPVAAGVYAFGCFPKRIELDVGVHSVSVTRPGCFEVVPREDGFLFRNGSTLVQLEDLGGLGSDPQALEPLDYWVDFGLRRLDPSRQREVARREAVAVGDLEIIVVETWDSLSHAMRRRIAFARNQCSLLALHTSGGDFELSAAAFESMLASLELTGEEAHAPIARAE